jgi:signal transduction histidine kinase
VISVNSIKGRLFLWIFISVTLLFAGIGYALHLKMHYVIEDSLDRMLHSNLQFVKGLVHSHDGETIECESNEFMQGDYMTPDSGHYYKVFLDGELLAAADSLPDKNFNLTPGQPTAYYAKAKEWVYDIEMNGEPLRVLRHDFTFMGKQIRIEVAENINESLLMIHRLANYFLIVMPVVIFLIGVMSLTIASFSLQPLEKFSKSLEQISPKHLEARLVEQNHARELRHLASKFNSLLERVQQAFESEKRLLGDAAHELKTPLAVIKAECDIALSKTREAERYAASLQEVRTVADTMLEQINGLLTLARLDSGILDAGDFHHISLNNCVADAIRIAEPLAKKKNIAISIALNNEITVLGDQSTLTEAILNLVENAIKYNHPGGFVAVELANREHFAELVVIDTGLGISIEDQERIFDRFYRSAAARNTEGSGLGLSIVRAIARTHQGDVTAEAQPDGGSRFILRLPVAESA